MVADRIVLRVLRNRVISAQDSADGYLSSSWNRTNRLSRLLYTALASW